MHKHTHTRTHTILKGLPQSYIKEVKEEQGRERALRFLEGLGTIGPWTQGHCSQVLQTFGEEETLGEVVKLGNKQVAGDLYWEQLQTPLF